MSEALYALTSNTVKLISTLGASFSRGGPVQDPVLALPCSAIASGGLKKECT